MRFFNTAGPVDPERHYYVPHRLDAKAIAQLIEEQKYFILHAPRQSGKTTAINILVNQLNNEGRYTALYINVEPAQVSRNNVEMGMKVILKELLGAARLSLKLNNPLFEFIKNELKDVSASSLKSVLQDWSSSSDKPILLFIDEIDSLVGDTLISVLRQIRAGYNNRPKGFPQSVCLIGVRDVRDYRIWSDVDNNMVLGGSAFNIKAKSLVLHSFSIDQLRDLYLQHTQETGQQFTDEAIEYAFYLTQGQPWLVNALAYQACFEDVTDRSLSITKEIIERAKETLIIRCDTHLDVLIDRLKETRVRVIIDEILSGGGNETDFQISDLQYARDLGLISPKGIAIANPIYQEIIPRSLAYTKQEAIQDQTSWYQNADGSLDMHKLLTAFAQFYRENSEMWLKNFDYKESGPHLLLMAFLQRIVNGGGKIHREYALGTKRLDLSVEWHYHSPILRQAQDERGKHKQDEQENNKQYEQKANKKDNEINEKHVQRIVIELKIKRDKKTLSEGLQQTANYMDMNNATEGHLVIFDRSSKKSWSQKIFTQKHIVEKDTITVWGM